MTNPTRVQAHTVWLLLSLALLLLALAGVKSNTQQRIYSYVFALDITSSMNVSDVESQQVAMTRIGLARQAVHSVLEKLPCGSSAGLAIFTEHRTFLLFAPVEVCDNYRTITQMLDAIDWRMAWVARSEVAKGLYSGIEIVRTLDSDTKLVFLTDGHEAPPINIDIRPVYRGERGAVKGVITGIGGLVPVPIPHLDADGKVSGYWTRDEVMQVDPHSMGRMTTEPNEAMVGIDPVDVERRLAAGQEHLSSLREPYLRQLATETGLDYLRINREKDLVGALTDSGYARYESVRSDVGWAPALLALLCLLYLYLWRPLLQRRLKRKTA